MYKIYLLYYLQCYVNSVLLFSVVIITIFITFIIIVITIIFIVMIIVVVFRSPDGQVLMVNSNDNYIRMFHIPDSVFTSQWDVTMELVGRQFVEIRISTQITITVQIVSGEWDGGVGRMKQQQEKDLQCLCFLVCHR